MGATNLTKEILNLLRNENKCQFLKKQSHTARKTKTIFSLWLGNTSKHGTKNRMPWSSDRLEKAYSITSHASHNGGNPKRREREKSDNKLSLFLVGKRLYSHGIKKYVLIGTKCQNRVCASLKKEEFIEIQTCKIAVMWEFLKTVYTFQAEYFLVKIMI